MSRTHSSIGNAMSAALLQVVVLLCGLLVPRAIMRAYGSEINGLSLSIGQFLAYFSLVGAGLANASVYALYKPLAERDISAVSAILSAASRFYVQSGYLFAAFAAALALVYPMFVSAEGLGAAEVAILVLVLGVSSACECFAMGKYRVLLIADQKLFVVSLSTVAGVLLNTTVIVLLSQYRVSFLLVRIVALLSVVTRSAILAGYVSRNYAFVDFRAAPNTMALDRRWDALYLRILGVIRSGAPIIVATVFIGLEAVSIYAVFSLVFYGLDSLLGMFTSGLSASFGDVISRRDNDVLRRAYSEFEFVYYMIVTWLFACALTLTMPFIRVYTSGISDVSYDMPTLGLLFAVNGLLNHLKTPQGMMVISAGLFRETRRQTTIQASVMLVGSIIFAQFWGLAGILVASMLSNLYRDIDLLFFVPRHVTGLPVKPSLVRMLRASLWLAALGGVGSLVRVEVSGYLGWLIWAMVTGTCALLTIAAVNFIAERQTARLVVNRISKALTVRSRHATNLS